MNLLKTLLLFFFLMLVLLMDEAHGHPKSWLTTTKRPRGKGRPRHRGHKKKPKRSVVGLSANTNQQVTFYPELGLSHEDTSRFEELSKILKEEEYTTDKDNDNVLSKLLQEKREPSFIMEPTKFAFHKRMKMKSKENTWSSYRETLDLNENLRGIQPNFVGNPEIFDGDNHIKTRVALQDSYKHDMGLNTSTKSSDTPNDVAKKFQLDESTSPRDESRDDGTQKKQPTNNKRGAHLQQELSIHRGQGNYNGNRHSGLLDSLLHQYKIRGKALHLQAVVKTLISPITVVKLHKVECTAMTLRNTKYMTHSLSSVTLQL